MQLLSERADHKPGSQMLVDSSAWIQLVQGMTKPLGGPYRPVSEPQLR